MASRNHFVVAALLLVICPVLLAQQPPAPGQPTQSGMQSMADCPMMGDKASPTSGTSAHHADVMARGAKGMGFSQEKTTHHFILLDSGGRIEVIANDASDTAEPRERGTAGAPSFADARRWRSHVLARRSATPRR